LPQNKKSVRLYKFPSHRALLGCLIAVNGVSYRVIKTHTPNPKLLAKTTLLHKATWPCLHVQPQYLYLYQGPGRRRILAMGHLWLQHGHKGVIVAFLELRRFGRVSGPDRWLRVPLNFPTLPSAEHADRVKVPWQRRTTRAQPTVFHSDPSEITPLEAEELIVGGVS
jgi:hypothetical protein